jgi:hypothetical protein
VPEKGHGLRAVTSNSQANGRASIAYGLFGQPDITEIVVNQQNINGHSHVAFQHLSKQLSTRDG